MTSKPKKSAGKPLPDKYRFPLFDDERVAGLIWNGKAAEVCNVTQLLPGMSLGSLQGDGESGGYSAMNHEDLRGEV